MVRQPFALQVARQTIRFRQNPRELAGIGQRYAFMDQEQWTIDDDPSKSLADDEEGAYKHAEISDLRRKSMGCVYFKDGKPEKPGWVEDAYVRKQSTLAGKQGKTVGVEVQGGDLVP